MLCTLFVLATWCRIISAVPLSDWIDGTANHYGGPQDTTATIDPFNPRVLLGGCNYGDLDPMEYPFYDVASFNPESTITNGLDQFGCGACFEIRCNDRPEACLSTSNGETRLPLVVVASGTCGAGCGDKQVNLHAFAFDRLAPIRLGNIKIEIRQVTCEPLGNLIVLVKNYRVEKGGYIKMVVRNVPAAGTLAAVQLRATGGTAWVTLDNKFGASWEGSRLPDPPFDLQLVESSGTEVILESVITEPGFVGEIDSGAQFPGFSPFPESARGNFVDSETRSPSPEPTRRNPVDSETRSPSPIDLVAPTTDTPEPFRVGASPSPSPSPGPPGRPMVDPDDLDPLVDTSGGK